MSEETVNIKWNDLLKLVWSLGGILNIYPNITDQEYKELEILEKEIRRVKQHHNEQIYDRHVQELAQRQEDSK